MNNNNALPDYIVLNKLGDDLNIPVRTSSKAKRVSIRINYAGAELILPHKQYNKAYEFLLSKESWVRRKLAQATRLEPIDDRTIPILGELYSLHYLKTNNIKVNINENVVEIHSKRDNHQVILTKFLQEKLLLEVTKLVEFFSAEHKLKYNEIKINDSKSKWGTCSSKQDLTFNWRLIFAPPNVVKYLVAHEMSHLIQMNHSQRFWNLVEKLDPNYKAAKFWLKKNGTSLHRYLLD
jgi:predicted metal-dependent hydrolase